jgi:hypothetical protein
MFDCKFCGVLFLASFGDMSNPSPSQNDYFGEFGIMHNLSIFPKRSHLPPILHESVRPEKTYNRTEFSIIVLTIRHPLGIIRLTCYGRRVFDSQLNLDHPLCHLATVIQWSRFDEAYAAFYCEDTGAPGLPTRLMVGLQYLKYTFDLSDEELVLRWLENPYWQYFCGETRFQNDFPCDATSLGVWRRRIGDEKLKLILAETIRIIENMVTRVRR